MFGGDGEKVQRDEIDGGSGSPALQHNGKKYTGGGISIQHVSLFFIKHISSAVTHEIKTKHWSVKLKKS